MARLFCRHLSWLWLGWIPRAHRVSSPVRPQRGRRRMLSPPSTISWCYYGGGRPAKPSQAKQSPGTLCHMSSKAQTTLLSVPWGLASAWLSSLALGLGGLQVDYGVILFWFCSNPVLLCLHVPTHEPCQRNSQPRGLAGYMLFQKSLSFPPYFLLWFPV